jgi:hypothetical protein
MAPGPGGNLIFDIQNGVSSSGFGIPACKGGQPAQEIIQGLEERMPIGPLSGKLSAFHLGCCVRINTKTQRPGRSAGPKDGS